MGGLTYFNIGDKRINLTQVKKILANKTHFFLEEIPFLIDIFEELIEENTTRIPKRKFTCFLWEQFDIVDQLMLDRIFKVIAKGNKAHLDVFEFISALSIMLRGTIEEKTRFSFRVYTLSQEKTIERSDLKQLFKNLLQLNAKETTDNIIKDAIELSIRKLASTGEHKITQEDFKQAVNKHPELVQVLGVVFPSPDKIKTFEENIRERVESQISLNE